MNIEPEYKVGSCRTALVHGLNYMQMREKIGFDPNVTHLDDPMKVDASWGMKVDGRFCAIWSYKGSGTHSVWSAYGDHEKLAELFGPHFQEGY